MTLSDEEYFEARRELRDKLLRLARWKLRETRRRWTSQRARRLPKQARALKSLLAELQERALGPVQRPKPRRSHSVPRATCARNACAHAPLPCGKQGPLRLPARGPGTAYK
jgi:hypothetical protein